MNFDLVKRYFKKFNIGCFIDYYDVFEANRDSISNKIIINALKNESWTENGIRSRASNGKRIFKEGLEIKSLEYIIEEAKKIPPETVEKAKRIYYEKTGYNKYNSNIHVLPEEEKNAIQTDISKIELNQQLNQEEKRHLVKIRFGQSLYRKKLIELWKGCSISGCRETSVLISSHIKAYKDSNENEKYDVFNGLLLSPVYDKLFDLHLISFEDSGKIIISNRLSKADVNSLNISPKDKLLKIYPENKKYLKYHRNQFLSKLNIS